MKEIFYNYESSENFNHHLTPSRLPRVRPFVVEANKRNENQDGEVWVGGSETWTGEVRVSLEDRPRGCGGWRTGTLDLNTETRRSVGTVLQNRIHWWDVSVTRFGLVKPIPERRGEPPIGR